MTYESLGQDELTVTHAVKQGTHDAIADSTKYALMAGILVAAIYALPKKWIRKAQGAVRGTLR